MGEYVSWRNYKFEVNDPARRWDDVEGVYIFAKLDAERRWEAIYIGQAESFRNRFSSHERWEDAEYRGVTHIHTRTERNYMQRCRVEEELIEYYQPPLNSHHKG